MCGILGLWNASGKDVKGAMAILGERGGDGAGWFDGKVVQHARDTKGLTCSSTGMGHALHAVVGHVPQPLRKTGTLVANCEIYNWQSLAAQRGLVVSNDADLLLRLLDACDLQEASLQSLLEELDGVYAFLYWRDGVVVAARDLIGVKPLWYTHQDGFACASEKKALLRLGYHDVTELNPRTIISYTTKDNKAVHWRRQFFGKAAESADGEGVIARKLKDLFVAAVRKRIPGGDIKAGILFSGGIDSTMIAKACKDAGVDFTCYTSVVDNPRAKAAHDLTAAKEVAARYHFKHKIIHVREDEVPLLAEETAQLIEEANAVKVSVGMPFLAAAKQAKRDGCKVLFSGLGAEELYAGYQRHKNSLDVNDECYAGLLWLYERDLYRDDVITMHSGLELRLPFLDKELVKQSLGIPSSLKLVGTQEKYVLRKAALLLGIAEEDALRPKKAAQYGSKFDQALELAARAKGLSRVEYLRLFLPNANRRLGVLCSGGKDSWYAAYVMRKLNYDLSCVLTMRSENKDSYMFHTPAVELVSLQAKAAGLPFVEQLTKGEKEAELADLKSLLQRAKEEYDIDGVVTGALFSEYQRSRVERLCDELGLKAYAPLWHLEQESALRELLREGFVIIMSAVAAEGLSKEWLGKAIGRRELELLVALRERIGFNVAGEGGEYESLVLDCPLFKERLFIRASVQMDDERTGRIVVLKARLGERSKA